MLNFAKRITHAALRIITDKIGYELRPRGEGYFDAPSIVNKAKKEGISVSEYLEKNDIGGVGRKTKEIIEALKARNAVGSYGSILEVGAGTGMYLEQFIELCKPKRYEVYETNQGWANYLKNTYEKVTDLRVHHADGYSLKHTADDSVDVVTAHGVFVYLPIVITFQYLSEAVRVCKKHGRIIFDCFSDRIFTADEILRFREVNPYYDFPVVIPEKTLLDFSNRFNLELETSFNATYHLTQATYFIFRKK